MQIDELERQLKIQVKFESALRNLENIGNLTNPDDITFAAYKASNPKITMAIHNLLLDGLRDSVKDGRNYLLKKLDEVK